MKKVLALIFALNFLIVANGMAKSNDVLLGSTTANVVDIEVKKNFDSLNINDQEQIFEAVNLSKINGVEAATVVNNFVKNQVEFKIAVRKVMDSYYSHEKLNKNELDSFCNNIDPSASEIIQNYKEAAIERSNADKLNYQVGKLLLNFPHGTPKEVIDLIVKNEAISYEIVSDGVTRIPSDLPEYKRKRLEAIKDYKSDILVLVNISLEDTVARAKSKFDLNRYVKYASKDIYFEADGTVSASGISVTTNDPHFKEKRWNYKQIDLPMAWNIFHNDLISINQIWVAVIDNGVKMNHQDLSTNLLRDYSVDVTQNNKLLINCPDEKSDTGQYTGAHGTMVSGIIAARANNSKLSAGVASLGSTKFSNNIKILAIKADDSCDSDRHITLSKLAPAINYAVDKGAEVINISYSTPLTAETERDLLNVKNAIDRADVAKCIVVASAGNDSTLQNPSMTKRYPAGYSNVIGVGATFDTGNVTNYSNLSDAVNIVAPGGRSQDYDYNNPDYRIYSTNLEGYRFGNGTSYSCPHVAATIAMIYSLDYSITRSSVLQSLVNSATPVTKANKTFYRLNAGRAVSYYFRRW